MTKKEAEEVISKIFDNMKDTNSVAIKDSTKKMGFSTWVNLDMVLEVIREAADE